MFQGYSLILSHSLILLLCPQVCSIFLCLKCCFANRFISIIFLDSLSLSVCVCVCVCVCMCVLLSQSCLALCNHMDCTWQGSSVHGILQARILELIAIPFFRGYSWPKDKPESPALQVDSLLSEPLRKSLGSIYMRQHTIFVFLFLTYFILLNSAQESPQKYGSAVACLRVRVTEYDSSGRHNMLAYVVLKEVTITSISLP